MQLAPSDEDMAEPGEKTEPAAAQKGETVEHEITQTSPPAAAEKAADDNAEPTPAAGENEVAVEQNNGDLDPPERVSASTLMAVFVSSPTVLLIARSKLHSNPRYVYMC